MAPHSQITLYSLQASRSIRIAFLLEELGLAYENHSFERLPSMKAPEEFRKQARSAIGKAPVLWDGELCVVESGAITEFVSISFFAPSAFRIISFLYLCCDILFDYISNAAIESIRPWFFPE